MKAIAIKQPWAEAIVFGHKDTENRNWATKFRGTVLVHASKKFDRREMATFNALIEDRNIWRPLDLPDDAYVSERLRTRCGGIIGAVDIVDCVDEPQSDWFVGDYGFMLKNARYFDEVIPCRGMLGFFTPPAEVLKVVTQKM